MTAGPARAVPLFLALLAAVFGLAFLGGQQLGVPGSPPAVEQADEHGRGTHR